MSDLRQFADLHMHSTASDGAFSPRQVVQMAAQRRLSLIALTDHDTVAGLDEAAATAAECGIQFINGIELTARLGRYTMDLLGYGFDHQHPQLLAAIDELRAHRTDRNHAIVSRLADLDIHIGDLLPDGSDPNRTIGRPHLARAMVRQGAVGNVGAAFSRFLSPGGTAFVARKLLPPSEVIASIHAAGGIASVAHPIRLACSNRAEYANVIHQLRDAGLDAIEIYHPSHDARATRTFQDLARQFGLGITGGSDFHGLRHQEPPRQAIGFSTVRVPHDVAIATLRTALRKHGKDLATPNPPARHT